MFATKLCYHVRFTEWITYNPRRPYVYLTYRIELKFCAKVKLASSVMTTFVRPFVIILQHYEGNKFVFLPYDIISHFKIEDAFFMSNIIFGTFRYTVHIFILAFYLVSFMGFMNIFFLIFYLFYLYWHPTQCEGLWNIIIKLELLYQLMKI